MFLSVAGTLTLPWPCLSYTCLHALCVPRYSLYRVIVLLLNKDTIKRISSARRRHEALVCSTSLLLPSHSHLYCYSGFLTVCFSGLDLLPFLWQPVYQLPDPVFVHWLCFCLVILCLCLTVFLIGSIHCMCFPTSFSPSNQHTHITILRQVIVNDFVPI